MPSPIHSAFAALLLLAPVLRAQPVLEIAWMKDADGDGAGDRVYLRFTQALAALPPSAAAQWSSEFEDFRAASGSRLSFAGADRAVVVLDYSTAPFPRGWTAIPVGGSPKAGIPMEPGAPWQLAPLLDSIGPVLLEGVIRPGEPQPGFPTVLDTLTVLVSEPLRAGVGLKSLLLYAEDCSDTGSARPVVLAMVPSTESGNPWITAIVERTSSSPRAGGCLALNGAGGISDLSGNAASESWARLRGNDPLSMRRPVAPAPYGRQGREGARYAADGRRLPPFRGGSAPWVANLITFMVASPQEGILR